MKDRNCFFFLKRNEVSGLFLYLISDLFLFLKKKWSISMKWRIGTISFFKKETKDLVWNEGSDQFLYLIRNKISELKWKIRSISFFLKRNKGLGLKWRIRTISFFKKETKNRVWNKGLELFLFKRNKRSGWNEGLEMFLFF